MGLVVGLISLEQFSVFSKPGREFDFPFINSILKDKMLKITCHLAKTLFGGAKSSFQNSFSASQSTLIKVLNFVNLSQFFLYLLGFPFYFWNNCCWMYSRFQK